MKKIKLIYNPGSGETKITDHLDDIFALYQKRGYTVVPYRLSFEDPAEQMLKGLDKSYHHILVAGGDGTVNYVVNVLKSNEITIPIAVLPTGTANDFASMIGMKHSNVSKACEDILDGTVGHVDLGKVNDRYFVNVFSCGLFTDISQKTPTRMKNTFGKLAYYVGGIGELPNIRRFPLKIESDGGGFDGSCLIFLVFNGRTAGKMKIAYLSEIDDGLLDVLIVKGDNPLETVQTLVHYMTPSSTTKEYPQGIVHIRCGRLMATCSGVETTDIDGQPGPKFPLEIVCETGALAVIRPKQERSKRRRRKREGVPANNENLIEGRT